MPWSSHKMCVAFQMQDDSGADICFGSVKYFFCYKVNHLCFQFAIIERRNSALVDSQLLLPIARIRNLVAVVPSI